MSRRRLYLLGVVGLFASIAANIASGDAPAGGHYAATGTIDVAFTPGDRIDRLIIGEIDQSKHEVMMLADSFTDRAIARALIRAHQRGVQVQVVADREQARALPQNRSAAMPRM